MQNATYGERKELYEDVPATMETPDGFRKINKSTTRRNLALRLLKNPKVTLILIGIILAIIVLIGLIN